MWIFLKSLGCPRQRLRISNILRLVIDRHLLELPVGRFRAFVYPQGAGCAGRLDEDEHGAIRSAQILPYRIGMEPGIETELAVDGDAAVVLHPAGGKAAEFPAGVRRPAITCAITVTRIGQAIGIGDLYVGGDAVVKRNRHAPGAEPGALQVLRHDGPDIVHYTIVDRNTDAVHFQPGGFGAGIPWRHAIRDVQRAEIVNLYKGI